MWISYSIVFIAFRFLHYLFRHMFLVLIYSSVSLFNLLVCIFGFCFKKYFSTLKTFSWRYFLIVFSWRIKVYFLHYIFYSYRKLFMFMLWRRGTFFFSLKLTRGNTFSRLMHWMVHIVLSEFRERQNVIKHWDGFI